MHQPQGHVSAQSTGEATETSCVTLKASSLTPYLFVFSSSRLRWEAERGRC